LRVYTETVVFSAPEAFVKDAPYQIAIVDKDGDGRVTGRILGERVAIGDEVELIDSRDGVSYFRKVSH
jgi:uncharacterized OB-fold protein